MGAVRRFGAGSGAAAWRNVHNGHGKPESFFAGSAQWQVLCSAEGSGLFAGTAFGVNPVGGLGIFRDVLAQEPEN